MFWLIVTFLLEGLLFAGISLPMILKSVKPNPWYGFRTPKTLSDPDIWYEANAYCGVWLFLTGLVLTVCSLLFALIPGISWETYTILCSSVMLVCMIYTVVKSFLYLNKL